MGSDEGRSTSSSRLRYSSSSSTSSSTSSSSSSSSDGKMNEVDDFVLMEILCRIPCAKTLTRCKAVSKRWLSVLSAPYFVCRRFSLHPDFTPRHHGDHDHHHRCSSSRSRQPSKLLPPPPPPLFLFTGQGSAFVPGVSPEFKLSNTFPLAGLSILASCNDLLLCAYPGDGDGDAPNNNTYTYSFPGPYYIFNPFATQRRETAPSLPPPPNANPNSNYATAGSFGLISYHDHPNTLASSIGSRIKYKVVFLRRRLSQENGLVALVDGLVANVFCSETRKWTSNYNVQAKGNVNAGIGSRSGLFLSPTATCNGSLYFLPQLRSGDGPNYIIAFHPSLDRFRLVEIPIQLPETKNWPCLGACAGVLQIFSLQTSWHPDTTRGNVMTLSVWEVEDEEMGQWKKAGETCLDGETILEDNSIGWQRSCCPLAIHPSQPDTVFIQFSHYIVPESTGFLFFQKQKPPAVPRVIVCSFNLKTKELKTVGEIGEWGRLLGFPVELPWWPTPVPVIHASGLFYV